MPTAIPGPGPLTGQAARDASHPLAETPRGGMEFGFAGVTDGGSPGAPQGQQGQQPQQNPFQGLGPILEDDDKTVFKQVEGLVLRQEIVAKNHLAQDTYYTSLVHGNPWVDLEHDATRDVWTFTSRFGTGSVGIQAIPNKNLDLVQKACATVLADFPEAEAEPIDDTEDAESAADMANRFLTENASEQGTNDAVLFNDRVTRALVAATSYIEGWVDPTGGGYVPLQIKAHPQAQDAKNPLVGPDGMPPPNGDFVLRYVTAQGQFTTDASQAMPQWQPRIMASMWNREHWRHFPEHLPIAMGEKAIGLLYCTISEGKRRWPTVAQMDPGQLNTLCDWTPIRYLPLLPPFQRARWKLTDGRDKEKAGSSDERIFFYFQVYQRATPDYPKGADVAVSGAKGGLIISRDLLSSDVEVPKAQGTTKETRCREIPVVQITPRADPHGRDPTGLSFLEQFVGATEMNATLLMGYAENIDKVNHTPFAVPSTSPISGDDVRDARASDDMLIITKPDDKPTQLAPPVLPASIFEMVQFSDEAVNSIASQERAAQGADNSQERSGRALQIAIGRNNISNTPMQTAVNNAVARWNRIKLELAMAKFTTPQLIKYEGEDGSYKESEFTGVDFALVGKVGIRKGTGTMMPPDQKVDYLGNLVANRMIDESEAREAARPAFSAQMGLAANPHEQYVERCIDAWLNGPPDQNQDNGAAWIQAYKVWQQANKQYQDALQAFQQQQQLFQQAVTNAAIVAGGPPNPLLGPEGQNEESMLKYQMAVIALRFNPLPPMPPQPPQPPQVPKPWTPFAPRPNDTEPAVSQIWMGKLSRVMSSAKYTQFGPEWQDVLDQQYTRVRQAAAVGASAQAPAPAAPARGRQPKPPTQPQEPQHAQPHGAAA